MEKSKKNIILTSFLLFISLILLPTITQAYTLNDNIALTYNDISGFDVNQDYIVVSANRLSASSQGIEVFNTTSRELIKREIDSFDENDMQARISTPRINEKLNTFVLGTSRVIPSGINRDLITFSTLSSNRFGVPNRVSHIKVNNQENKAILNFHSGWRANTQPYGFSVFNTNSTLIHEEILSTAEDFGGFSPVAISPDSTRYAFGGHADYNNRLLIYNEAFENILNMSLSIGNYRDIEFINNNEIIITTDEKVIKLDLLNEQSEIINNNQGYDININRENNFIIINYETQAIIYDFDLNEENTINEADILKVNSNDDEIFLLKEDDIKIYQYEATQQQGDTEIATLNPLNVDLTSATIRGEIISIGDTGLYPSFLVRNSTSGIWEEISLEISTDQTGNYSLDLENLEAGVFYDYRFKTEEVTTGNIEIGEIKSFFTTTQVFNVKQDFEDIRQGLVTTTTYDLKDYVEGFNEITLRIQDTINSISLELNTNITGEEVIRTTPSYSFKLTPTGETIILSVTTNLNEFIFPADIIYKYAPHELEQSFNIIATEEETLNKIGEINNVKMGLNEVFLTSLNNYFSGYERIRASFYDDTLNQDVELIAYLNDNTQTYETNEYIFQLIPYTYSVGTITDEDIRLKITSKNTNVNTTNVTLTAIKSTDTENIIVSNNFDFEIQTGYSLNQTPEQYRSIKDLNLNYNEEFKILYEDYFLPNTYTEVEFFVELTSKNLTKILHLNNNEYEDNEIKLRLNQENNGELIINTKNKYQEYKAKLRVYNNNMDFITSDEFLIRIGKTPSDDVSGSIYSLLPRSEDLNVGQRYIYVIGIMFLVSVIILALTRDEIKLGLYLALLINAMLLIFFISIGYLNIGIIVLLVLLGLIASVMFYKRGGN